MIRSPIIMMGGKAAAYCRGGIRLNNNNAACITGKSINKSLFNSPTTAQQYTTSLQKNGRQTSMTSTSTWSHKRICSSSSSALSSKSSIGINTTSTTHNNNLTRRSFGSNNIIMEIPRPFSVPMLSAMSSSSLTTESSSSGDNSMMLSDLPSFHQSTSCSFYSTLARRNSTPNIISNHNGSSSASTSMKSNATMVLNNQVSQLTTPTVTTSASTTTTTSSSMTPSQTIRAKTTDAAMDDEYGAMTADGTTYTYPSPYHLESFGHFGHNTGNTATSQLPRGVLDPAYINYNTYGKLNEARDNVLVICHALTGNASLEAWWGELLGPGKAFDTDQYFIVCCNMLGSCYGSVGPSSPRPGYDGKEGEDEVPGNVPKNKKGEPIYGMDFPDVSVRDTVRLQLLLLKHKLKISSVKCVIGGSFGGMQAMEYCVMAGATRPTMGANGNGNLNNGRNGMGISTRNDSGEKTGGVPYGIGEFVTKRNGRIEPFVRSAIPIACGAVHTAWQIGISETQRQAIYADPKWNNGRYDPLDPPANGLSVARQVAMVSYRTPLGYHKKFGRALTDESGPSYGSRAPWQVKSYLEYQGRKFLERFDPVTYVKLTEQMDSHDVGRGRGDGSIQDVLSHVEIPVCVLGIDSDVLYPLSEQSELAKCMPNAELKIIHSDAGHDGFLLEQDQVAAHIKSFLYSHD